MTDEKKNGFLQKHFIWDRIYLIFYLFLLLGQFTKLQIFLEVNMDKNIIFYFLVFAQLAIFITFVYLVLFFHKLLFKSPNVINSILGVSMGLFVVLILLDLLEGWFKGLFFISLWGNILIIFICFYVPLHFRRKIQLMSNS